MKTLVVAAFFAILVGLGITVVVQHDTPPTTATVAVSAETQCRTVTRRALDSLAHGKVTQSKAQALVDGACDSLPAATRNAIVEHEKQAAIVRNLPPTPSK